LNAAHGSIVVVDGLSFDNAAGVGVGEVGATLIGVGDVGGTAVGDGDDGCDGVVVGVCFCVAGFCGCGVVGVCFCDVGVVEVGVDGAVVPDGVVGVVGLVGALLPPSTEISRTDADFIFMEVIESHLKFTAGEPHVIACALGLPAAQS
jgi:hypothetical protein